MSKLQISDDFTKAIVHDCEENAEIKKLTNEELAERLINEVWAEMPLMSTASNLVDVAIDRLQNENEKEKTS